MKTYIVHQPVITEKSVMLAQTQNVCLFEVDVLANKDQIHEVIEKMFNVEVERVRTVKRPTRTKKTGRRRMTTQVAAIKKAYVKVKNGQKISAFDIVTE